MNARLMVIAFVVGLVGGCSFTSKFESYCLSSQKCRCTGGQCCVVEGQDCDSNLGCCAGICGIGGKCPATSGFGGGFATGGGGGSSSPLHVLDAGSQTSAGLRLVYPDGGLVSLDRYCDGGGSYAWERPTWIHPGGTVTTGACCDPRYVSGTCNAGPPSSAICVLPGFRSSPGSPCCFCDQGCREDDLTMICPFDAQGTIDAVVDPVPVAALPPDAFCADGGGLKALGGCCSPNSGYTDCFFDAGSCSLDAVEALCCFTAWQYPPRPPQPDLLNDCRVNGACECNPVTTLCTPTPGARCVDILGR